MSSKVPIRAVFNASDVATGLAEYQSGEFIPLTHGGLGASLSIGSAGQVLKVNTGGSALEFGNVEAIVNIDAATDKTSATLVAGDQILLSDGGTEGRVTLSQLDTLFSGTTKTLTNKTLTSPTITSPQINGAIIFEGDTADANETTLQVTDPTADRTITLPNVSGTVITTGDTGTVTNTMLAGSIAASKLAGSIGNSKLTNSKVVVTDGSNASNLNLGNTLTFSGTSNEIEIANSSNTVTVGIVSNPTLSGDVTITGDLTIQGDDLTMNTNTSGALLIADGTNYNPTLISDLSEISTIAGGDTFLAIDASGGGLKKVTRSTIVAGLAVGGAALSNVVEDATPQLGGDLDVQTNAIVSTSNRNIAITPNGSGKVVLDGISHPTADGSAGQVLKTDGSATLSFTTVLSNLSEDSSPQLGGDLDVNGNDIVSTSNGNINLLPNGSGTVIIDGNGSTGGIIISDGNIDMRSGSGAVSKIKFYCEVNNAHAQTLQAQPHSAGSSAVLTLPVATGTLIGSGDTGSVTNTMLAGSIAASKLAGSIGNSKLSNSSISVSDGSSSTATALGGTITFSGTSNEVTVSESSGTVTIGLPDNVTVGGNLTITGNLNVNGSTTTVDSTTVSIQNAFVFEGATDDAHETTLTTIDPTADRTISLPNVSGTIITTGNFTDITNLGVLSGGITFEGSTADGNETTLAVTDPTADRTITLPDETFKVSSLANKATLDGDGSTTTITVGSGYNVNQFLVTINGIVQEPTEDYTYSSTTLTLGTAPVSGERVVVRY